MNMRNMWGIGVCVLLTVSMLTGCGGGRTESDLLSDGVISSTSESNTVEANSVTKKRTSATASGSAANGAGATTTAARASATGGASSTAARSSATASKRTNAPSSSATTQSSAKNESSATTAAVQQDEYVDGLKVVARIGGAPLCQFDNNLYKLDVPFEQFYTSVFFLRLSSSEWAVVDTATKAGDVNTYIVPAAAKLGIQMSQVKAILLTHDHSDHAGGMPTLLSKCPNATVYGVSATNTKAEAGRYQSIADGASLFGGVVKMVTLRGHAVEACGYYDTRSKTVMTGDSIQFYGVGYYGCQLYSTAGNYENSMQKLKGMVADGVIENILISHPYVPVISVSKGRENSLQFMTKAQQCYEDIKTYTINKYNSGVRSEKDIMAAFIAERSREYPNFPTNSFDSTIKRIINAYC